LRMVMEHQHVFAEWMSNQPNAELPC